MGTDYDIIIPHKDYLATVVIQGSADELESVYRYFEDLADIADQHEPAPKLATEFLEALSSAFLELREYVGYKEPSHE